MSASVESPLGSDTPPLAAAPGAPAVEGRAAVALVEGASASQPHRKKPDLDLPSTTAVSVTTSWFTDTHVLVNGMLLPAGSATPQGMGLPRATKSDETLHILYADDEAVNCSVMARMCRLLKWTVVCLSDGDEVAAALVAAGQLKPPEGLPGDDVAHSADPTAAGLCKPFDAVVLDIQMDRVNGDVVCRQLRACGNELPFLAATGATPCAGTPCSRLCA